VPAIDVAGDPYGSTSDVPPIGAGGSSTHGKVPRSGDPPPNSNSPAISWKSLLPAISENLLSASEHRKSMQEAIQELKAEMADSRKAFGAFLDILKDTVSCE